MSLYNALFGVNPMAGILMQALNIKPNDVPRFRDCYLDDNDGKPRIGLHTRTGGNNRDDYEDENESLRHIAGFQCDEDDDFDNTYATFYYDVPTAFVSIIATMREITGGAEKPGERWQRLLADLRTGQDTPEAKRALTVATGISTQINAALDLK